MDRRSLSAGVFALVVALVLSGVACGGDDPAEPSPVAVPSSSEPSPADSVSIYPPPGSPAPDQGEGVGSPASGEGEGAVGGAFANDAVKRTDSRVQARVDGQAVDLAFDTVVEYPMYEPPNGIVSLTWADSESNALTLGGTLFEGTRKTSARMALSLALTQPKFDTFGSGNGTCTVTFVTLQPKFLAGSFECGRLKGSNGGNLEGATGTFEARF